MSEPGARVPTGRSAGRARRVTEGADGARWVQEVPGMDRDKMLGVTLSQIEKQYGKGAVMRLGEHPMGQGVSIIPTGALALDLALGIGGIPRGRIVEVFGPEGSGKTTVCLHIIAETQRAGGIAIFINQLREKIGVMFGNPETTPGGRALKFYSSVRLDVRKIDNLKDGTEVVGSRVRVKVVKNKLAPPFRLAEFDIVYGKGISREGSLIDVGITAEIVKKSGAWFTYEGDQLGQGRENAKQFLAEHQDVALEIERKVRAAVGMASFDGDE